jgi:hypothetical protein
MGSMNVVPLAVIRPSFEYVKLKGKADDLLN